MARLLAKGRPQHIPSQTDTVVRFVQEHVAVFLCLCELVKKGATKATTRNGAAQGMEEHDIYRSELIQWLGLLRNMSCSSCICLILG